MKTTLLILSSFLLTIALIDIKAQGISPDKFNNLVLKDDLSLGIRVPGWLIKRVAKWSTINLEEDEQHMIRELSKDIKKIRVLVNGNLSDKYDAKYLDLKTHLKSNYENLIDVRSEGDHVNIWVKMDGEDMIKNFFASVKSEDGEFVLINIKTKLTMEKLKSMNFFQELNKLQST